MLHDRKVALDASIHKKIKIFRWLIYLLSKHQRKEARKRSSGAELCKVASNDKKNTSWQSFEVSTKRREAFDMGGSIKNE